MSRRAWWLALLALVLTSLLLRWAMVQDEAFLHANPAAYSYGGFQYAPAWTLAALVNGPAFLLGGVVKLPLAPPFDQLGRALASAAFWLWVGLSLDRRNSTELTPVSRKPVVGFIVGVSLLTVLAVMLVVTIGFAATVLFWHFTNIRESLRLFGLRSPVFAISGTVTWLAGLTVSFARKFRHAARLRARTT